MRAISGAVAKRSARTILLTLRAIRSSILGFLPEPGNRWRLCPSRYQLIHRATVFISIANVRAIDLFEEPAIDIPTI